MPRRRIKDRMFAAGMVILAVLIVGVVVAKVIGFFRCERFESEMMSLAARHLGQDRAIDVSAIASARIDLRDAVEARGGGPEKVRMGLLRKESASGSFVHVLAVDVAVDSCHADLHRALDRRLSAEELAALAQFGVHECGSCVQVRRHEHEH